MNSIWGFLLNFALKPNKRSQFSYLKLVNVSRRIQSSPITNGSLAGTDENPL